MIFRQWYSRFRRVRVLLVLGFVLLITVFVFAEDWLAPRLAPTCDERPAYHEDVPLEVRARLDTLFDNGLLYCAEPGEAFEGLDGPIYWGSDGMQSDLFFQAEDMRGVGLRSYGFASGALGEGYVVNPPGDGPPAGYGMIRIGSPSRANQAEGEDPTYYYRVSGAPADTDSRVYVVAQGSRSETGGGVGEGDVWQDIDRIWNLLRGEQEDLTGVQFSEVNIPIRPALWLDLVRRQADESLVDTEGQPLTNRLSEAGFDEPAVWQTVSGLFGNTVWLAGVDAELVPAMRLEADGQTFEPHTTQVWDSGEHGVPLAMFAFDPLPLGSELEASFWADEDDRDAAEPDARWPLSFPE